MSASPARSGARIAGSCAGSCCPSPSTCTATSKPCSKAYRYPVWTAPPIPRLKGRRTTWAPCRAATDAVSSADASSTTTTSMPGSKTRSSSITRPTFASSFSAGTIASRRSPCRRSTTDAAGGAGAVANSATDGDRRREADQVEDLPRAMRVRVLVEHALARPPPHLLRRGRVGEQLAVRRERLVGARDDAQLRARLEPPLHACDRRGDDGRSGGGELERPCRRGGEHCGVRPPRDVQVDPRP